MKKFLFAFIVLNHQLLFAQMKQKECYPIYINYPAYSVKANIVSQNKKTSIDRSLTYYWYASNKIQETVGGVDGKMLHGSYSAFYLNGNLKEKGFFKSGVKNGEWTTWYDNGKIWEIANWQTGKRSKITLNYNYDGDLASSISYKNGKLNGYQIQYKNGVVQQKKKYKNGVEVTVKVKEKKLKKQKTVNDTEEKHNFSTKYKIIAGKIRKGFAKLKIKKNTETKELNERKKKNVHAEPLNKKQKDNIPLSLKKKKESAEKRTQIMTPSK